MLAIAKCQITYGSLLFSNFQLQKCGRTQFRLFRHRFRLNNKIVDINYSTIPPSHLLTATKWVCFARNRFVS